MNLFFLTAILSYQITINGETSVVPDLTEKTFLEAQKEASSKRLILVNSGIKLHDKIEEGKIIDQIPSSKERVKLYQEIKVIISAGKEQVEVPSYVGTSFQSVTSKLKTAGLKKGKNSSVSSTQYSAGNIIAQTPVSGQMVPSGTRISFLVSEGQKESRYLMPDLIGKSSRFVVSQLKRMGFQEPIIRERFYPGSESGIILNQIPKQGHSILKRNPITLEVSK